MIFLIEYNRKQGRLIQFKVFRDSDRSKVQQKRLEIELDLNNKRVDHEVVLLEAAKEGMVRRTHRRYFETLRQIGKFARG